MSAPRACRSPPRQLECQGRDTKPGGPRLCGSPPVKWRASTRKRGAVRRRAFVGLVVGPALLVAVVRAVGELAPVSPVDAEAGELQVVYDRVRAGAEPDRLECRHVVGVARTRQPEPAACRVAADLVRPVVGQAVRCGGAARPRTLRDRLPAG